MPAAPARPPLGLILLGLILLAGSAAAADGSTGHAQQPAAAQSNPWPPSGLDWQTSAVDLSFLNAPERPAGKHGFLRARQEQLVFADGTVARFWGTNLTADALFGTNSENVRRQARRLSELGFNLVRIHHHDSEWVDPNVFGAKAVADNRHLDAAMLTRLDWWLKCLKDEGIYVWLDLHVGRHLRETDQIDGFAEIAKGAASANLKGYNYVNPSIRKAMQRFNGEYVAHENLYTGVRYRDEPAIIGMLISNENDITNHFGNLLLPAKNVPFHTGLYMGLANAFAAAMDLPQDKVWRSWEPGPAKLFLNDLEWRFDQDMIADLRRDGVKVPIVPTSMWGDSPLWSLPALTAGEIVNAHAYGRSGELGRNPLQAPNLVNWLAAAHVAGKPMSVSEWNVEQFPAFDRHTVPLYLAASASHQGWSAVMQYAYSQKPLNDAGVPSNWHAFNDPAFLATMPAAALLFRRGDVREATNVYAFQPDARQLFYQAISPANSPALRLAAEMGKLVVALPATKELPWLVPSPIPAGAKPITDPNQPLLPPDATEVVADSGELRRNWQQGLFTIDTPRTQAAMGQLGGRTIDLDAVQITLQTPTATVAVQSLDGKPIAKASRILVSLAGESRPKSPAELPYYSEPLRGRLTITAPKGLGLYRQRGAGAAQELPMAYRNGRYVIELGQGAGSGSLLLRPRRQAPSLTR